MMNWPGIGRVKSWCKLGIIIVFDRILEEVLRKGRKNLSITDKLYKIQARCLLNVNPQHYCYTSPFGDLSIGCYTSRSDRLLSCLDLQAGVIAVL
jgi:hypothetical protein